MNVIDTDILVVGSGAAGLMAAAAASVHGVNVIVINKGHSVNCTTWADRTYEIAGGGGCGFAAPIITPDGPEKYFEDLNRMAGSKNIPELTSLFAEKTIDVLHYLVNCGVRFKKTPDGKFLAVPEIWHSFPRILYSEHGTGKEIIRVLKKQALSSGVRMLEGMHAFKLLVANGEVRGCLAFVKSIGEIICFRCKAIIIATGGAGRLFQYTTNPPGITGDGILLAKEAGAELINMELYSDIPMSLKPVYGLGLVPYLIFAGVDTGVEELLNSPKILWKYNPSKLSIKEFQIKFPKTFKQLQSIGFNLVKDTIELYWMSHFMLGGIRINTKAETSIKGLYAAGEVAGGITGEGRLPGTGIAEGLVFGKIAGQNASVYAKKIKYPKLDKATFKSSFNKTKKLSKKELQDLRQIKSVLAYRMYQALREKKSLQVKTIAEEFESKEKEINKIFGSEYVDFIPSHSQAEIVFEIKSALAFGKIFLKEGASSHQGYDSCNKKY